MHQGPLAADRREAHFTNDVYRGSGRRTRALPWFAAVAVAFTVAQLVLVVPGLGLGWDETVYVSQVSPHAPAAFFSAPRARGITFLAAPVTELTTSVSVLRCYLAVLSGAALFLGLWVWRRLLPVAVLTLAGTLLATLWITLLYGPQVMPNLWVAFAALIATGCFLRAVRDRADHRALLGIGGAVAVAALMRPSDALWLAMPLAVAALSVRSWRRPAVLLVLTAGVALGAAEWVVEAYAAYGGLIARLQRAGEIQGGLGWHPSFDYQLRALDGRSLCRPCDAPWRHPTAALWWLGLPLLTAGGAWAAVRARLEVVVLIPTLTGLSLAAPYLLMVDYAAPRFLLPTYALLFLPVSLCLTGLVTSVRPGLRAPVVAVVALVLVAHLAGQYAILRGAMSRSRDTRESVGRIAAELDRQGVRPPCTVTGFEAVRIGFRAGCASRQLAGHDSSITRADMLDLARRQPVAVLVTRDRPPPGYALGWRPARLPPLPGETGFRVYLSPSARP